MEFDPKSERRQDWECLKRIIQQGRECLGEEYDRSGIRSMHDQMWGLLKSEEINEKICNGTYKKINTNS